jgi:DNA-binding response OmpR family regulator
VRRGVSWYSSVMAKKKILVVDDSVAIARALKTNLDDTGRFEVRIENDPRKARAAVGEFGPDLVLLDVIMPGMDGGAVAAEIRQDVRMKDMPVIFLTSILNRAEAEARGGKLGDDPVLAKPVTVSELLAAIDKVLG